MRTGTIYSFFCLCLLLAGAGCTVDSECRMENTVRLHAVLVCDSLTATGDTVRFNAIDSITVQGVGNDSLLLDNAKNISSLALPLRNDSDETAFLLTINGQQDVLTVRHRNEQHFISLACGCFVYHTIEDIRAEGVFVDAVEILNSDIANYEQDNIRIRILLKH